MDLVLRATAVYLVLLLLFALLGKRTFAQVTVFDFVILLIVSEATGEALVNGEPSITGAFLAVMTLLVLSRFSDMLTFRFARLDTWLNDSPVILVEDGRLLGERTKRFRIDEADILEQARASQGLERLGQIRYAVLERDGQISIIPN